MYHWMERLGLVLDELHDGVLGSSCSARLSTPL